MIFGEVIYFCALLVTALCYWASPERARSWILSLSGIAFYSYYAGNSVWLLLVLTLVSWALLFSGFAQGKPYTRILAIASIPTFVGVLGYYKYSGFLSEVFRLENAHKVIAPLAISFFIFEFIHLGAERLKGTIKRTSLGDYCAFLFFFPTMIAGPIKRYHQFSDSLETPRLTWKDALEGVTRIIIGMVKKMVIADNLNTIIEEAGTPSETTNVMLLTGAVVLYGLRIYLDFSGYSDIAIGSARLLGFRVPENFLHPYRQGNISSFWRHWHVSLYTWLIDYVFIPLGGSKGSLPRACVNIIIVMLVSGIWHGAAWNFVLWGLWHGVLLAIHKVYRDTWRQNLSEAVVSSRLYRFGAYVLTMVCVWFGWLLFMWPWSEVSRYLQLVGTKIAG
ncbi:MAG TPA: MBOAT family O-acyltransferase [Chthoniobacterales bacterium]|jgi:alginate O-acetyltransferase complex protein AlgI